MAAGVDVGGGRREGNGGEGLAPSHCSRQHNFLEHSQLVPPSSRKRSRPTLESHFTFLTIIHKILAALLPHPLKFSRIFAGTVLYQRERNACWCRNRFNFQYVLFSMYNGVLFWRRQYRLKNLDSLSALLLYPTRSQWGTYRGCCSRRHGARASG